MNSHSVKTNRSNQRLPTGAGSTPIGEAKEKRAGWLITLGFLGLLLVSSLACAFLPDSATPTPSANQPPVDEVISFLVPLFTATLEPGESVSGTGMQYLSRDRDAYNVSIDGLMAAKKIGDSFIWKGVIAPGVVAKYSLRISPNVFSDNLIVAGPVEIFVLNPVPIELQNTTTPADASLHFGNIGVDYSVPRGKTIPGTTLLFEGVTDQGAQLSGTDGYPYRVLGDSLIWYGRLRGNVNLRYSMRVTSVNEDRLHVVGLAELSIAPKS